MEDQQEIQQQQQQNYPQFNDYDHDSDIDSQGNGQNDSNLDNSDNIPQQKQNQQQNIQGDYTVTIDNITTQTKLLGAVETHFYTVKLFINGEASGTVDRRYSDFFWLFNQLSHLNTGLIIPPIPEKNAFVKFGRVLNQIIPGQQQPQQENQEQKQEAETLKIRKVLFQQFLSILLKHPILKNSDDLHTFLKEKNYDRFKKIQEDSEFERYSKEKGSILYEKAAQWISWGVNTVQTLRSQQQQGDVLPQVSPVVESQDDRKKFDEYLTFYNRKKDNLVTMLNLFEGIFDYKKKMAENLKEAIDIFQNIENLEKDEEVKKEQDESNIDNNYNQLIGQCKDAQVLQQDNYLKVVKEMQWPLKGYVIYLQQCINILNERNDLINKIEEQRKQLQVQQDDQMERQLDIDQKKLLVFTENFKQDSERFNQELNKSIEKLVQNFSGNQKDFSKQMLDIWGK